MLGHVRQKNDQAVKLELPLPAKKKSSGARRPIFLQSSLINIWKDETGRRIRAEGSWQIVVEARQIGKMLVHA